MPEGRWLNSSSFARNLTSRELLPAFVAIRNDLYPTLFPNREYPTNTLLIVGGLVDPALLLEVEAVAIMWSSGAEGGIRTHDRRFTKPLLYP